MFAWAVRRKAPSGTSSHIATTWEVKFSRSRAACCVFPPGAWQRSGRGEAGSCEMHSSQGAVCCQLSGRPKSAWKKQTAAERWPVPHTPCCEALAWELLAPARRHSAVVQPVQDVMREQLFPSAAALGKKTQLCTGSAPAWVLQPQRCAVLPQGGLNPLCPQDIVP